MKNLKITAVMQTGQVSTIDGYLPLDSILAYAWMQENHPDLLYNQDPKMGIIEPVLPLEKREGYWACSFAEFECTKEEVAYWHRRTDSDAVGTYVDFGNRRGKINTTAGTYKAYRMPIVSKIIPEIYWYAVGEKVKIEQLLCRITHIGKKRSQGKGAVTEWIVQEIGEDYSEARNGLVTRAVPFDYAQSKNYTGYARMHCIAPPYWDATRRELCLVP